METETVFVGRNMKWLREREGLTLTELSKELQIPYNTMLQYESEKTYPKLDKLVKIADFFHVSLDFLVREEVDETIV